MKHKNVSISEERYNELIETEKKYLSGMLGASKKFYTAESLFQDLNEDESVCTDDSVDIENFNNGSGFDKVDKSALNILMMNYSLLSEENLKFKNKNFLEHIFILIITLIFAVLSAMLF